ncbi:MAG: RdgB/HAM1 family non-canonical purine NTP pyrophosphatase [Verrucomicrobiaceae bacterium]|nr:RdgB/HAM1 family non-canonical purine NTP pyrophosphatase [Verrucomicrobiaceae bacterium]
MHRLLLATRNPHKTGEFTEILGEEFVVRDLSRETDLPPVEETGATFAANAILKAVATSKHFPGIVVGDDSGLEVDALNGAPGIYSARYAGAGATDQQNVAKLLVELDARPHPRPYSARFRCVLALARDGELLGTVEGAVDGIIVDEPRGSGGFGYDPVFQPVGSSQTFGELSPVEKHQISHRARAIYSLRASLLA